MINRTIKRVIILPLLCILFSTKLSASQEIKVGGYIFPPFVEQNDKHEIHGITLDLIDALNAVQDEYHFKFVLTSSRRRYVAFENGRFDVLFFESMSWGWGNHPIEASKVFLEGGEVFIALKSKAKNQSYFKDLNNKSISAMLGYHYGFANFNADPEYLNTHFDIHLSSDEGRNIQLVLSGLMDLAIVTQSYLEMFIKNTPSSESKLLVSEKMDQVYKHTVLVRKDSDFNTKKMNQLIDKLIDSGELERVLQKYGVKP